MTSAETTLVQGDASILTSWKYRPDLMRIAADELEDLTTIHLCYTKAMTKPIRDLKMRPYQLNLNGHCMQILDWPNSIKVDELHAALEKFDPLYDKYFQLSRY
eukprot:7572704-Ditylum_brightwellii.AAC.1